MKRRHLGARQLEAHELVDLYLCLRAESVGDSHEVRMEHLHQGLAGYGYTPLDAMRARLWLQQGKPSTGLWTDQGSRAET